MTPAELAALDRIVERLRLNVAQAKVDHRSTSNTYSWGLADGLEIGLDMIRAYRDRYNVPPREDEGR